MDEFVDMQNVLSIFELISKDDQSFLDKFYSITTTMYDFVDIKPFFPEFLDYYINRDTMIERCLELEKINKEQILDEINNKFKINIKPPFDELESLLHYEMPNPSLIYFHAVLMIYMEIKIYANKKNVKFDKDEIWIASKDWYQFIKNNRDKVPHKPFHETYQNQIAKWIKEDPENHNIFNCLRIVDEKKKIFRIYHCINLKKIIDGFGYANVYRF